MRRLLLHAVAAGAALLASTARPAWPALAFGEERRAVTARVNTTFRSWTIHDLESGETQTVEQLASRLVTTIDATDALRVVLFYSGGLSQAGAGEQDQLDGGADLKLKGFYYLANRRVLASVGVNLPTGQTSLSESQIRVASAISPTVLGFPMRRYGEGFDVDLGITAGQPLGRRLAVAAGASLLLKGAYDVDPATEYAAGEELALTAGADWRDDTWFLSADAVYRTFGTDEINGEPVFDEGSQLELTLRGHVQAGAFGFEASVRDIVKGSNGVISSVAPGTDQRIDNGNTLWLSAVPSVRPARVVELRGLVDVVAASQSHQQATSAWALGVGGGAELLLTPRSVLELRGQYLTGESEDEMLDLSGWESAIFLGIQY